jgi:hypothetical protein
MAHDYDGLYYIAHFGMLFLVVANFVIIIYVIKTERY